MYPTLFQFRPDMIKELETAVTKICNEKQPFERVVITKQVLDILDILCILYTFYTWGTVGVFRGFKEHTGGKVDTKICNKEQPVQRVVITKQLLYT